MNLLEILNEYKCFIDTTWEIKNFEDMFPWHYMHCDICSCFKSLTANSILLPFVKG